MNIRYISGPKKGKTADVLNRLGRQLIAEGLAEEIRERPDFQGIVDATQKPEPEPTQVILPVVIEQPNKKQIRKRPKQ